MIKITTITSKHFQSCKDWSFDRILKVKIDYLTEIYDASKSNI